MRDNLAIYGGSPIRKEKYLAYHRFDEQDKANLGEVIDQVVLSAFYGSKRVREFEETFAAYHNLSYGIATSSGTAALHVAYIALGLLPGDEVIVPANAYISAATAALQAGAFPIFADICPDTFVLDPERLEERISAKTKLIVPVHLYGQPVDMHRIMEIARPKGIRVVEDCAQAHGAMLRGRLVGAFGDAGVFSLCCRKHVVSGEGGIVITNIAEVAGIVRSLVNKGKGLGWWDYERMGYSYLMTDLQAVLALSSLARLRNEIRSRRRHAEIYRDRLRSIGLLVPQEKHDEQHIYFKFPFLLPSKFASRAQWFESAIQAENVVVERSYPVLYHIPWMQRKEGIAGGFPYWAFENGRDIDYSESNCAVAEDICYRLLAACTGPGIGEREILETCDAIERVFKFMESTE